MQAQKVVAEILGYGVAEDGAPVRRVRYTDGSEGVQRGQVTVGSTITRADGTVEPGGAITDIRVGGTS